MPRPLGARQLAQIRKQMERDLIERDREKLRTLRASIRSAKRDRQGKLRQVGASCRAAARANMERAKRARARLRESILRMRERAKGLCEVTRGETKASTLKAIERAVGALETERAEQRKLSAWVRPRSCAVTPGRARAERKQESDCEVAANLDDPGLRVVWEHLKAKIKASPRRTRTEAFLEWAQEHRGEVYRIQEADAERALVELEKEERKLAREVAKAGRFRKKSPEQLAELLAAVPF